MPLFSRYHHVGAHCALPRGQKEVFEITGNNGVIYIDNQNTRYSIGPLSIFRQTKQALTVFGIALTLDEYEFNALDMLAARAEEPLPFELLYKAVWSGGTCSRDAAKLALNNLLRQVTEIGRGFMWIEYQTDAGYIFRTRWSHNLRTAHKQG